MPGKATWRKQEERKSHRTAVIRACVLVGILLVLFLCGWYFNWGAYFSEGDFFTSLDSMVDENLPLAALIYIVAMVVCCVLLALPGIIFALIAGALFGPFLGTALCVIAATIGAVASFLAGRYFLRDLIAPRVAKNKLLSTWLMDEQGHRLFIVLMVTRLVPIFPYNLQNFAYGITPIKLSTYTWGTFLFLIPGTAIYTFAAAGIIDAGDRWTYLVIAIVLFIVVTLVSLYLRKRFHIGKEENREEKAGVLSTETTAHVEKEAILKAFHEPTVAPPLAHTEIEYILDHVEHAEQLTERECNALIEDASETCIHCHLCKDGCVFLAKYGIDIGDVDVLDEHHESCFMCGRCTRVCPVGIDGKSVVLAMRQKQAMQKGRLRSLLGAGAYPLEKWRYPFKNYRHAKPVSFFPGCSLLSSYPQTTKAVADFLAEKEDIGVIYDCCGSPLYEAGVARSVEFLLDRLSKRLLRHGVREILVACPHCRLLLEGRLPLKVSGVYEKLREYGVTITGVSDDVRMFPPCPDRTNLKWYGVISDIMGLRPRQVETPQCCGFGGGAASHEPELSRELTEGVMGEDGADRKEDLFIYCASCGNALGHAGCWDSHHVLSLMMGLDERPDVAGSFKNRVKSKFI